MPERVLVIGGAGFVGSHVAEHYAVRDREVTVFDNMSRVETLPDATAGTDTAAYNAEYLAATFPDRVEFVEGDVRDGDHVAEVVKGHDAVVHVAGQVAVTTSLDDPQLDFSVNAGGTLNVLEAASEADSDPAVVFASTNKVYGKNVNDIPVREEESRYVFDDEAYAAGVPESLSIDGTEHTPYGVSKLAGDLYVQDYARRNEVDAAAFRMSCIYGPRQFGNEDQGWVAHFALSALRDDPVTIFGNGKQVRDVLYVDDLIRAYDAFFSDSTEKSAVYNVGGGPENTTSLVECLDTLEGVTGNRPPVSFEDWREGDQRVYVSDVSRARHELDWEPTVSFDEGIRRFVDWYRTDVGA